MFFIFERYMKASLPVLRIFSTFLVLSVVFSACRTLSIKKDYQKLTGSWKEEWGTEDVKYNDVYRITPAGNNQLIITCENRPEYIIDKVHYDGKVLRLQVEIRDEKYRTGSAFVRYELKLMSSPPVLIGTAINHQNKTIPVKWMKQQAAQ